MRPRYALLLSACLLSGACKKQSEPATKQAAALRAPLTAAPTRPTIQASTDGGVAHPVERVVRRYVDISLGGDLRPLKEIVYPSCYDSSVGRATITLGIGRRIRLTALTVSLGEQRKSEVDVNYTITGDVEQAEPSAEIAIDGKKHLMQGRGVALRNIQRRGMLTLRNEAGRWWLICPKRNPAHVGPEDDLERQQNLDKMRAHKHGHSHGKPAKMRPAGSKDGLRKR
ncbi:MAG: hypothetical protein H6707_14440 [Deltaproteobacteria bacterium]|nr:hypothetical protein [Deltaproteobacteria bacterium]